MKFITDATGMEIQQISFDRVRRAISALLGGQVDALSSSQVTFASPDAGNFADPDDLQRASRCGCRCADP